MKERVICGYCQREAELVPAASIYRNRPDLIGKHFWRCSPCKAWVGCHPKTHKPLGRLANAELRKAKQFVHQVLDPIWKSGDMTRAGAYKWLADTLGISPANCHVGMFDIDTCRAAYRACRDRKAVT